MTDPMSGWQPTLNQPDDDDDRRPPCSHERMTLQASRDRYGEWTRITTICAVCRMPMPDPYGSL